MAVHLSGGRKERHTVGQRSLVLRAWVAERRGRVWGWVSRALMFLGQETPSPSCTLYLSAHSPIFIRLYLRLESVPLHFLLRSSSSFSASLFFFFLLLLLSYPALSVCRFSACPLRVPMRWQQHANILVFAIRMPQNGDGKPRRRSPSRCSPCRENASIPPLAKGTQLRYSISPRKDKLCFGRTRAVHEKRIVSKRFQYFSPTTPVTRLRVIGLAPGQRNFLRSLCLWLTLFHQFFLLFPILSAGALDRVWENADLGNSFSEK